MYKIVFVMKHNEEKDPPPNMKTIMDKEIHNNTYNMIKAVGLLRD